MRAKRRCGKSAEIFINLLTNYVSWFIMAMDLEIGYERSGRDEAVSDVHVLLYVFCADGDHVRFAYHELIKVCGGGG